MFYLIVKEAQDGHWEGKFRKDPKINKVNQSKSVFYSDEGKAVKCKLWYSESNKEIAEKDCIKLNTLYPNMGYALCPLKD